MHPRTSPVCEARQACAAPQASGLQAFRRLVGLPSWGWRIVYGSLLDVEFGPPRLRIREPLALRHHDPTVQRAMARRRITPTGTWTASFETDAWDLQSRHGRLLGLDADQQASPGPLETLRDLDGQSLASVEMIDDTLVLGFDLGGQLRVGWRHGLQRCSLFHGDRHLATLE